MGTRVVILLVVLAVCVQCLPVEPKFRQMSLQAESQTSAEIQTISARITFLEKLNKLTYDTTLFTRKLRWLLRRALTEKPTVAEVAELMNKELEISKAQIEVAVEGVADELKLEVKQGIIALKAGLAFIEDNYKAGSDPEADAIIAKIKANLAALEARFGKKTGTPVEPPPAVESTAEPPPAPEQSTAEEPPAPEQSTAEPPPPAEESTAEPPPPAVESSTTEVVPPPPTESTGGSLIGSETATEASTGEAPPAEPPAAEPSTAEPAPGEPAASTVEPPAVVLESSTGSHNDTNSSSSSTGEEALAESPLFSTSPTTSFFF